MAIAMKQKTINTKSKHRETCRCCDGVFTKDARRTVKKSIRHNLKQELNNAVEFDNF